MTIHDEIKLAVSWFKGQTLETAQIIKIVREQFPEINADSILPNEHADGNANPCWCAKTNDRIFERITRGKYKVR